MIQKGFNSDIQVRGCKYHVQTEDWGFDNPFIVSRIFYNGSVFKTIKTSYKKILESTFKINSIELNELISEAIQNQHHEVMDRLMSNTWT